MLCQDLSVCLNFFGAQGSFQTSLGSCVRRLLKEVVITVTYGAEQNLGVNLNNCLAQLVGEHDL